MSRVPLLVPVILSFFLPVPLFAQRSSEEVRFKSGNIQVKRSWQDHIDASGGPIKLVYHNILRDQIDFGRSLEDPKYRRMPITYYHPQGPVGLAFQRFNWFPGPVNTYHADARLAVSLVGCAVTVASFPATPMGTLWSEPPIAVIGMAAGTPGAYARPLQHFHFYEPTRAVINLSDNKDTDLNDKKEKQQFFHFIPDARARGARIQVFHGSPREQLRERGPRNFYHLIILESCTGENGEKIFLDLFTKEGIAECMHHLVDDGILCVHTSHRFVDLPPVLAAIGKELGLHVRRGHDQAPGNWGRPPEFGKLGHWTSEWVLLCRKEPLLHAICIAPPRYREMMKENKLKSPSFLRGSEYWDTPRPLEQVWTDKGPNQLHGILRGHPMVMRYSAVAAPCADFVNETMTRIGLGTPATRRFVFDLAHLPRPVENWLVDWQLKTSPRVEKLWP